MSEPPAIEEEITDPSHAAARDYRVNRFSFESLLASFASTFITLRGADVDTEIEEGMLRILEYLDLDRSTVIQGTATRESKDVPRFTHACARKGLAPLEKAVVEDYFPWLMARLSQGEMVVFSSLDELPPEAAEDREAINRRGACSMAAIPFVTQGEYLGALVCTTVGRERHWDDRTIRRLHLTGQIFASVLLRKRAENDARSTAERFAAVARLSSDIIFDYDVATRALDWLGDIDRLLGYRPGEFPRTLDGWVEALHPEDRDETVALVENHIRTGPDSFLVYRIRCRDGSYRNWEVNAAAVEWDGNGVPRRWAGACTDVTARLRAETLAQNLRDQLVHVSRISTLGELTATLAHELNQPLTAILSNAQAALRLLDRSRPDLAEIRAILADIVSDDQRAGGVIKHLRSFLKKHDPETAPLFINELIRQVLGLLKGELSSNKVRVKLEFSESLQHVAADRFQLQQVILNLSMNAIEAMADTKKSGRVLTISTHNESDRVKVCVSDSGKGISDMNIDALFDPFFTTKSEGMGMGLAICKSIVEAHGGSLRAAPIDGGGSSFCFTLPLFELKGADP